MRPLNVLKNFNYSKKNFLPIIIILSIQICLLVYIISLGVNILYEMDCNILNIGSNIASVAPKSNYTADQKKALRNDIEHIPGVVKVIDGNQDTHASAKLIFFGSGTRLVTVKKQNLNDIMKVLDIRLNSGRMPENPSEIIVSEVSINAFEAKIGDMIGRNSSRYTFELLKDYRVVGTFSGDCNAYLTCSEKPADVPSWLVLTSKDNSDKVEKALDAMEKDFDKIISKKDVKDFGDVMYNMIRLLGTLLITVYSFAIWLSVFNLTKNNIVARKSEFAFLRSVGYSNKFILKRLSVELGIIMLAGFISGILLGELAVVLFNSLYCYPQGISFALWHKNFLIIPGAVTAALFIVIFINLRHYIKKLDWVTSMEEAAG